MICCMPFTYLDERYIRKLTGALGSVSVYAPSAEVMAGHLLDLAREGILDLRYPQGVDAGHLSRAFMEFKAWADLHRGDIADMAAFSKSRHGHPPLFDETNPTAIGDMIRNFSRQDTPERDDATFTAALFLTMAQEYDQQQDAVAQDLGMVTAMEQDMLAGLAGGAPELQEGFGAPSTPDTPMDCGAFMTDKRLQAWAELACKDNQVRPFTLYVTPSPSILENLLDRWPQARGPWRASLKTGEMQGGESHPEVLEALKELASASNEAAWRDEFVQGVTNGDSSVDLVVYVLTGTSPDRFVNGLLGAGLGTGLPEPSGPGGVNTLIGLFR